MTTALNINPLENVMEEAALVDKIVKEDDEVTYCSFTVETSVADSLSDKAHNYILQLICYELPGNVFIGIEQRGTQSYYLHLSKDLTAIPVDDCMTVKQTVSSSQLNRNIEYKSV